MASSSAELNNPLQAVVGFSFLEVVNYIEHYGLARQRTATGRYEKVDPRHSWNSDAVVSRRVTACSTTYGVTKV